MFDQTLEIDLYPAMAAQNSIVSQTMYKMENQPRRWIDDEMEEKNTHT